MNKLLESLNEHHSVNFKLNLIWKYSNVRFKVEVRYRNNFAHRP